MHGCASLNCRRFHTRFVCASTRMLVLRIRIVCDVCAYRTVSSRMRLLCVCAFQWAFCICGFSMMYTPWYTHSDITVLRFWYNSTLRCALRCVLWCARWCALRSALRCALWIALQCALWCAPMWTLMSVMCAPVRAVLRFSNSCHGYTLGCTRFDSRTQAMT